MTAIQAFEELLRAKQIPLVKATTSSNETSYSGSFQVNSEKEILFDVVFKEATSQTDVTITYHQLIACYSEDNRLQLVTLINQLNQEKTAYYRLVLTNEGEVSLVFEGRTGEEILPLYEILLVGSSLLSDLMRELKFGLV
ncbi:hypothetical protein [Carnobacterium divergens]|uniref:hypothetical protein n=1 Tax=Carnobacterium divergens TaxID=2748 RepID=UPI0010728A65|nr:hypothetical protein [Carnobacterium divergens]TFI70623.1 hypothetical protein CKN81_10645 [Carnobacterium divergens]